MQGVILGVTWAQDPVVLFCSCQLTFRTAVHYLLGGVEVSTLGSGRGVRNGGTDILLGTHLQLYSFHKQPLGRSSEDITR